MPKALIFDFDGVVADSEPLANTVLAELLRKAERVDELKVPLTDLPENPNSALLKGQSQLVA